MDVEKYVSSLTIPKDAPSLNGEYLESIIPGFRTSSVEGRFNNTFNIEESEKNEYASRYKKRKFSPKEWVVHFNITCNSQENLNSSIKSLNKKLYGFGNEVIKFIFNNDQTVFYTGVISSIQVGRLIDFDNATGSYTIHLSDGKGYSVTEYEVEATTEGGVHSFKLDYDGAVGTFPVIEAVANSDIGYLAFANQNGSNIKIGDPNSEADSGVAVNSSWNSTSSEGWSDGGYTPTKDIFSDQDETFVNDGTYSYDNLKEFGLFIEGTAQEYSSVTRAGLVKTYSIGQDYQDFIASFLFAVNATPSEMMQSGGGLEFVILGHEKDSIETVELVKVRISKPDSKSSNGAINLSFIGEDAVFKGRQVSFDFDNWTDNTYTGKPVALILPTE